MTTPHSLPAPDGAPGISPDVRDILEKTQAARDAGIALAALADPIGPEHTAEEIARSLFTHKDAGAAVMGAMAHPPDALAAASGANVAVVECGAIPRDTGLAESPWRAFAIADALAMLEMAGYRITASAMPS